MKSRYWSFIVYPESVIENWEEELIQMGCCFAVSPLHDKDINATGEEKKAHYHVLIQFDGPTTYNNVNENICNKIGATIPKNVLSLRGYYRYLCHLDNPEKYQYDVKDIKEYGGFHLELTTTEITNIKAIIIEDIKKHNIKEYNDLCDYYKDMGDMDFFEIVSNHTYFFDRYVSSKRYKENEKK